MRKSVVFLIALMAAVSVMAQTFTDVDSAKYQGKTGLKALTEVLDANFAIIEGGAYNVSYKPTSGPGVMTITGNETNDATVVLDADDGDNDEDTWTVESEQADNDLSFVNHTTERAKLTAAGALHVDTINELGTSGVIVEGMTMNDGAFTDTDGSLTIQTVTASGAIVGQSTLTLTNGAARTDAIELGHASQNTLTASSGNLSIEGNAVYRAGGTDVPVTDGGSGASTLTDHGVLVGSGTDAITALTVGTDNQVLRGATGADPAFGPLVDADLPATITKNINGGNVTIAATKDLIAVTDNGATTNTLSSNGVLADDIISSKGMLAAVDFGDFTAGADGTCALDADVVGADELADGDLGEVSVASGVVSIDSGVVDSDNIVNGTIVVGDVSVAGLSGVAAATPTAAAASSLDYVGAVHRTVVTITNASVTMTDGSDEGHGVELMTFPQGRILILSAAVDLVSTNGGEDMWEADTNDQYVFGVGTAAAEDDATLAAAEADIIASTTIDTSSGTVVITDVEADMTAGADSVYDGTASAVKLYVNWAAPDTALDATGTIAVVPGGTLSVVWAFLGDD